MVVVAVGLDVDRGHGLGCQHLVDYHKEFNNVFVPQHYENKDGFKLGDWVGSQRRRITPKRRDKLDKLGFVWNPNSFIWEKRYKLLEEYLIQNGNTLVPKNYKTTDGFKLGSWVRDQRRNRNSISNERKEKLNKLGFIWKVK